MVSWQMAVALQHGPVVHARVPWYHGSLLEEGGGKGDRMGAEDDGDVQVS